MNRRDALKALGLIPIVPSMFMSQDVATNSSLLSPISEHYRRMSKSWRFYEHEQDGFLFRIGNSPLTNGGLISIILKGPEWDAWTGWSWDKSYWWEAGYMMQMAHRNIADIFVDFKETVKKAQSHYRGFPEPQEIQMKHRNLYWGPVEERSVIPIANDDPTLDHWLPQSYNPAEYNKRVADAIKRGLFGQHSTSNKGLTT